MKRGFTLVEIMVVVVIIGILAAVAVPKLFGTVVKAKASEIPVAAGGYEKLQEAYVGIKPGPGSWREIGYIAPGNGLTTNFKYGLGCVDETVSMDNLQANTIGWVATSRVALDGCTLGSVWAVTLTAKGSSGLDYGHLTSSTECVALTHSWTATNVNADGCDAAPPVENNNADAPSESGDQSVAGNESSEEPSNNDSPSASGSSEEKTGTEETSKQETSKTPILSDANKTSIENNLKNMAQAIHKEEHGNGNSQTYEQAKSELKKTMNDLGVSQEKQDAAIKAFEDAGVNKNGDLHSHKDANGKSLMDRILDIIGG